VRATVLSVVALAVSGCGTSSDYTQAAGQLTGYALNCAVFTCPDSPRTYVILQGRVVVAGGPAHLPLGNVRVVLKQDGQPVAVASTDRAGRFKFTQDIADGFYDLVLDSSRHRAGAPVVLEGRPRTVDLQAVPIP
jgi:hypothetical protein